MANLNPISRVITFALIFYFIIALLFASLNQVIVANGEPIETDNGNGTFNATWSFDNPLNYTANNITINEGEVNLTLGTYWWNQSSQWDFNNGTFANTTAIPLGELILNSEMGNDSLIKTGNFSLDQNWTYTSGDNITSGYNATGENAQLGYSNLTVSNIAYLIPETGEDDGTVSYWISFFSHFNVTTEPFTEIGYYDDPVEPMINRSFFYFNLSSIPLSATITDVSFYANIQSDSGNATHRIDIHALDVARAGNTNQDLYDDCANGSLYVDDDPSLMNGSAKIYHEWNLGAPAKADVQYNLSRGWFGIGIHEEGDDDSMAFLSSNESGNPPQLNVTYLNSDSVTFNETAYVNQTFFKPNVTLNSAEAVNLSFDYSVEKLLNTSANLSVEIDGVQVWDNTISATAPLTTIYVDVGLYMNESRDYNISFQLHMDVKAKTNIECAVKFDNVSITTQGFSWQGSYTSQIFDAGSEVFWDEISWNLSSPSETDFSIRTRHSANGTSWDNWSQEYTNSEGEKITSQTGTQIQYTVNLSTTNYTRTPALSDVNISYKKYHRNGTLETEDFIPVTVVRWDVFNSTFSTPANTNITYWYSTDSGNSWYQIYPGDDLSTVPVLKIRFRMNLSTSNTSKTPTLYEINLTYITDDLKPLVTVNVTAYGPFNSDPIDIIDVDFDYGGIGNTTLDHAEWDTDPLFGSPTAIFTIDTPSYNTDWGITWLELAEGWNTVYIRCYDLAGNVNDTETITIFKDTIMPGVTVNIHTYGPFNSDPGTMIDVDFDGLGGTDLDYAQWDTDPVFGSPTTIFSVDTPSYNTDWGVTWLDLGEGINTVYIRCYDLVGNVNDTETITIFKDTIMPGVTVNTPTYGPFNSDPGTMIDVDFDGLGGTDLDYAEWDTDPAFGSSTVIFTVDSPSFNTNWGITWLELVEGQNTVYIRCYDLAGNVNDTETITIFKDTIKPGVTVNTPSYGPFNSDPGNVIDVDFDGLGGTDLDYAEWDIDPVFGSPTTIFSIDTPSYNTDWGVNWLELAEGWNTIYIRCFDLAGNVNDPVTITIFKDTVMPEVTVNTPTYGPFNSDPGNVIDVDFSSLGGTDLDHAEWDTDPAFGSPTAIFTIDTPLYNTNWSVTWSEMIEGQNTIYIRCSDITGNVNDSQYILIVRNTPPDAPDLIEPYNGKIVVSSILPFSWAEPTDSDGDEIVLYQLQWSDFSDFSTNVDNEFITELFFTPESPISESVYYWRVRAFDDIDWGNFSAAYIFTLDTTYYHPRIINPIAHQVKPEEFGFWVLEPQDCAEDIDSPASELTWYITGENTSLYMVYNEYTTALSLSTIENKFGNDEVKLWVRDKDNNTDFQMLWINITPVNDEPKIESIDPLIVHYDAPYRYYFYNYIGDIETPKERLILETNDLSHAQVDGLWVTFNYPKELLGETIYVSVSVMDEQGALSSTVVSVTVSDDWVPELIKKLPDVTMNEGESIFNVFDLDDYFTDPDGDSLYYATGNSQVTITINQNNTVDILSPPNWYGTETVTLIALDPLEARAEDIITILVHPINDPPTIANVPDLVVHYDEVYSFNLAPYISDPDSELNELEISTTTQNITFDGLVMSMNFSKSLEDEIIAVVIVVSDGMDSDFDSIGILVSDDHPPKSLVENLPPVRFYEDTVFTPLFSLHDFFTDEDPEDTLYYTNATGGILININQTSGRITLTPYANWSGIIKLTVRALDPYNAIAESDMTITVIPVNDPPVIEPIPDQEHVYGSHWIMDLKDYISDIDNDDQSFTDLTITVHNLHPEGVSLIGTVLIFDYPGDVMSDNITITVNDGENEVSSSFSVRLIKPSTPGFRDNIDWKWLIAMVFFSSFLIVGLVAKFWNRDKMIIEEAFLVNKFGVLIKHATRRLQPNVDDDILAAMLTAVQAFISDSFKYSEDTILKGMEFGDNKVIIKTGEHSYLAIVYAGEMTEATKKHIKKWMDEFEEKYGDALSDWDGDSDVFRNLDELTCNLFEINQWRARPGKSNLIEMDGTTEGSDIPNKSDYPPPPPPPFE